VGRVDFLVQPDLRLLSIAAAVSLLAASFLLFFFPGDRKPIKAQLAQIRKNANSTLN
jgi:hypothetical protein